MLHMLRTADAPRRSLDAQGLSCTYCCTAGPSSSLAMVVVVLSGAEAFQPPCHDFGSCVVEGLVAVSDTQSPCVMLATPIRLLLFSDSGWSLSLFPTISCHPAAVW